MENPFVIPELEEHKSKLKSIFNTYSEQELLIKYRESLTNPARLEKIVLFEVLTEKVKDINLKRKVDLYHQADMIASIEEMKKDEVGEYLLKQVLSKLPFEEVHAQKIIECMVETSMLYSEQLITNEDLYAIEKSIDSISIPNLKISNKSELERIYYKFKEFAIDVYLKEQAH
jgi:hypothetical protein